MMQADLRQLLQLDQRGYKAYKDIQVVMPLDFTSLLIAFKEILCHSSQCRVELPTLILAFPVIYRTHSRR